jgi:hypothetical protein
VLFRSISFKELVDSAISKLGFSVLVILFSAYIAAIIYFSALPFKSRFSTEFARSNALGFFQQAFYYSSILTVPMLFTGLSSFLLVLFLYIIIFLPMLVNAHLIGREFKFEEYVKFRSGGLISMIWEHSGIAFIWLVLLGELTFFLRCDPTIPLLGWAIIIYSIAFASFQTALGQSYLSNISSCLYAKIITIDGSVEGFIVAKGSDHYVVMTKEKVVFLSNSYVKSFSPLDLPKLDRQKKRPKK